MYIFGTNEQICIFILSIKIKIFCYCVCHLAVIALDNTFQGLFTAKCTPTNTWGFWISSAKIPPVCMDVDSKSVHISAYLFWCSSVSQSCLQSSHISAHCVYSANYSWRLCIPSAVVDSAQINLFLRLAVEVRSVCLDHSSISLPIPCSHLYVTSDEQACCSLLETLHGSLAL